MINWTYEGKSVVNFPAPDFNKHYGFIYEIEYTNGQKYVGKKSFWSITKKNLTKKEIEALPSQRMKKWKYVARENKMERIQRLKQIDK